MTDEQIIKAWHCCEIERLKVDVAEVVRCKDCRKNHYDTILKWYAEDTKTS